MGMRLVQILKGVVSGWLRSITVNDADPGLSVKQYGVGSVLDLDDAGNQGISILRSKVAGSTQGYFNLGLTQWNNLNRAADLIIAPKSTYKLLVTGKLQVAAESAADKVIVAKMAATPTGNAIEVQDSAGAQVMAIEKDGDIKGVGGFKQPFLFKQDNCAAAQSAVPIEIAGQPNLAEIVMPFAGSVVGISVISSEARTAGTLAVDATVNGTATGLQATLDAGNPQSHSATQAKDTDAFNAGDRLGVKITTSADWAPTTADIVVTVIVES